MNRSKVLQPRFSTLHVFRSIRDVKNFFAEIGTCLFVLLAFGFFFTITCFTKDLVVLSLVDLPIATTVEREQKDGDEWLEPSTKHPADTRVSKVSCQVHAFKVEALKNKLQK